jgi:hypothetical protein
MGAAFGNVDTESGPPSAVPLQHFVVGLAFLMVGVSAGVLAAFRPAYTLPHVHLLLVGWVCVTIMGAMTQFVPVWSDTSLYSRKLARMELILVSVGVVGLAAVFSSGRYIDTVFPGLILLAGLWTFVYNIGRTLPSLDIRSLDVTEKHFLFALAFVLVSSSLGVTLAADYRWGFLTQTPFGRRGVVGAHATFAVFGIIVTTVLGAMYQLVTMFTQTELYCFGKYVKKFETLAYPVGVIALAVGRLTSFEGVAQAGTLFLLLSAAGFGAVALRKLHESRVNVVVHPMLIRYVVGVLALLAWTVSAAPGWVRQPLSSGLAGGTATSHLLFVGFVGYVVVGTLYHIVPFLVWVERYSDRLGLEDVPMIDDLYDSYLERTDLFLTFLGTVSVYVGLSLGNGMVVAVSGAVMSVGYLVFFINLVLVIRRHKPGGVKGLVGLDRRLPKKYGKNKD